MKHPRPARAAQLEDSVEAAQQYFESLDAHFLGRVEVLRAQLAKSNLGVALQGAEVRQVRSGAVSSNVSQSPGRLMGWSLRETTGVNSATVYLRDGTDTGAPIVAAIQLAAAESTRDSWFPGGLSFNFGLYVDVTAGAVEGAVYLGAVG